jgi:hypothetical protein
VSSLVSSLVSGGESQESRGNQATDEGEPRCLTSGFSLSLETQFMQFLYKRTL